MVRRGSVRRTSKTSSKKQLPGKDVIVENPLVSQDKNTKANLWRVIAPFLRVAAKKVEEKEDEEFSFYLQKKPEVLLRDLSSFMSDSVELPSLFHETSDVLKKVTKASWACLYLVDRVNNEIYLSHPDHPHEKPRHRVTWKINEGSTVASYVANNLEYVLVEDVLSDMRFSEGAGYYGNISPKSVLCIPVVTPSGDCFAVIELLRQLDVKPFDEDDLRICVMVTAWMGVAIHQNQQRLALKRQQELNDYLLDLIKCYFQDHVLIDKLMVEVIKFAKVTLGAERGSFFIIDNDSDEMVAHLFDDDFEKDGSKAKKVRFSKETGIAGLVARTGETINITDAYNDSRFNKEIDQRTGYITRSILSMPIMGTKGVLGVVQVVNKKNGGCFSTADENLFKTFSLYCYLSMHYANVNAQINKRKYLDAINWKAIKLQQVPCIHDIRYFLQPRVWDIPLDFDNFSWYVKNHDELLLAPQYCIYMLTQLINPKEIRIKNMIRFILSVRKTYRDLPYHNFEHAFHVCHCMYAILRRNIHKFTKLEVKALLIASLCHNIDHVGYTNSFLELINHRLAKLYDVSYLENHHYFMTVKLLEYYEVFRGLNKDTMAQFHNELRKAIIATDSANFFNTYTQVKNVIDERPFSWANKQDRSLIKALIMNVCDFSGYCKPFLVSKRLVDLLYKELYAQGDIERQFGVCPLAPFDRHKVETVPDNQIRFLNAIVLPCTRVVRMLLPNTEDLHLGAILLRFRWQELISTRGTKIWRQDDSIASIGQ